MGSKKNVTYSYHPGEDIFQSTAEVLTNPVNCMGFSGTLAGVFARRFPEMEREYRNACRMKLLELGRPVVFLGNPKVVLFPTMQNPGSESYLEDIRDGLIYLRSLLLSDTITFDSIAIPMLGCGVGGLYWPDVDAMIHMIFDAAPISLHIELYGEEPCRKGQ